MAWKKVVRYHNLPMKPKDLKFPFSWEERKPFLQEKILYIPNYYFQHEVWNMPEFSEKEMFGNSLPVNIEFCSGNGEWIINKALENPFVNWIAVEKNFDRVRKIWSKRENNQIKNLLIVSGYAEEFVSYYLKKQTIANVFVNFPDPWPKDKHAKNRLFQESFVKKLAQRMTKNSMAYVVTDDEAYLHQIIEVMKASKLWQPYFKAPYYIKNPSDYGESWFERLWKGKGKNIFHTYFVNQGVIL
ncbi:MAG: tRNA (guanosine(46)-N7)-methyltransferase TrmB [Simkaniaceae bacterium]